MRFPLRILHATVPIDLDRCSHGWYFLPDYGRAPGAGDYLTERIDVAFLEDKAISEATEAMVRCDPRKLDSGTKN